MKNAVIAALVIACGLGIGGGAAFGANTFLAGHGKGGPPAPAAIVMAPVFVRTGEMLAPLVFPDGRLAGYVNFDVQLEVAAGRADYVGARLPLLLHAVNMRTYRTPMTSGPDGLIPNLAVFRTVLTEAATEAFGPGVVLRAAIVQAAPA
jgi:hypothetical protein